MKTVGIIGGLGPETTSDFYLDIVFSCQKKDKTHRPSIIIASVPLPYKIEKEAIIKNINSTCYVLSSISEGMPNSLMEAMASGIPSISTNCNYGPSELIINGKNGLLVDVGDFKGLAKAIKSIISNEELAMRLSIESQKLKNTNSIEKISSEYSDFIIKTCIFYKNTNIKKGKR